MSALAAVRLMLLDNAAVVTASGSRGFAPELLASEAKHMPRKCFVLSYAGRGSGLGDNSYLGIQTVRLDLRCYGGAPEAGGWGEAEALHKACERVLVSLRGAVYGGQRLYTARPEAGPVLMRDTGGNVAGSVSPDTGWPLMYSSWLVTAARVAADVEVS